MTVSKEKSESLHFYKYLCQKVGTEEDVKIRRLNTICIGMGVEKAPIISGSKGEGLYFKSSDLDVMYIDPSIMVYESQKEVVFDGQTIPLIMNTEETQPCFTQLCLHGPHYFYELLSMFQRMFEKTHLGCMFSSTEYKVQNLFICDKRVRVKIHGPCITDLNDFVDMANCLRCKQWILQAHPWIIRARTTWPPPEIIFKIITCGMLFVPIGLKGSISENLEWRISFSVAEKFLVFSFSHTQLLCYALLKILLKDIVEKHADLKGLLCSYFLKTLMFWISEETDPNYWRPDNIIHCFMTCLKRLIYCVRYSILPHYFIPANNLFCLRFNVMNKEKLTTLLENLYKQGINFFVWSETLKDYKTLAKSYNIHETLSNGKFRILLEDMSLSYFPSFKNICLLYHFLHHSSSVLSKGVLALHFSKACMYVQDNPFCCYSSENKLQYWKYKYDLSHLLIGVNSDAVSGWLRLSSFFYVNKHYHVSLAITKYTSQKCTGEKIYVKIKIDKSDYELDDFQKYVLNLMKKEKLYTACKTLQIYPLMFMVKSTIIPQELHLDVTEGVVVLNSLGFKYFLSFLCCYHLQDITSCRYYLQQLRSIILYTNTKEKYTNIKEQCPLDLLPENVCLFLGIAYQLLGDTDLAKQIFQILAKGDSGRMTSAASRLKLLSEI